MDINALRRKDRLLVIGLMSGTSADAVDAALVEIEGHALATRVRHIAFLSEPFDPDVRERILHIASGAFGGAVEICRMGVLLGHLYARACKHLCQKAAIETGMVDLVGCHGQTIHHEPVASEYLGFPVRGTLQIGESAIIAQELGCPVVSDFRVRDMAAGGQGAPLVPYVEFLLYRDENQAVALQNMGGIGNVTLIPKQARLSDVVAFDTGPGNMVMDQIVHIMTAGRLQFDQDGNLARQRRFDPGLLQWMADDPYLAEKPPKSTGRERYGNAYVERLMHEGNKRALELTTILATATRFSAHCVALGIERFCPEKPALLIVGGGGSRNSLLMEHLRECLPYCRVVTNEEIGRDGAAKEAVAFAVLANETIHGSVGNVPSVTGAATAVVLGKISH
jgi:anhydro-N-acetylmuramic acid kinase